MLRNSLWVVVMGVICFTSVGAGSARSSAPAVGSIVICSGHGVVHLYVDADGNEVSRVQLCPDAATTLLHYGHGDGAPPASQAVYRTQHWAALDHVVRWATRPVYIYARGPPLRAS